MIHKIINTLGCSTHILINALQCEIQCNIQFKTQCRIQCKIITKWIKLATKSDSFTPLNLIFSK